MSRRAIVVPLGEVSRVDAERTARPAVGEAEIEWLDRNALRRAPFATLVRLWLTRFDNAVLVAPDLRQRRLRLTALLLAVVRARKKTCVDVRGAQRSFGTPRHLAQNVWPVARHLVACGLAVLVAESVLRFIATRVTPVSPRPRVRHRILYLRSQLWLGLQGGGSVAHTAGVIGGLQQAGAGVRVVSSDALLGVSAPTFVCEPETWFDEPRREIEDLVYNVAFFLAALRQGRAFRPTAIYQRHTAFNCAGAVLAGLLRVPLILEFNSSELWKGQHWGGLRRRRAAELVEQINLRAASTIVVVSRVLCDDLVTQGVPPEKILVNPNAVDPTIFSPEADGCAVRQRLGIPREAIVIGFSGTFGLWHGIPTLAQTLPMVPGVHWLLIGDGPLRHLVESPRLPNVTLAGLVPHGEMPSYLAACDILVSPHGRQADGGEFFGSPTKLYEYMAMARPIVASGVGQIAEVLVDGRSALLVPPDDPEALCHAISRLVGDPDLRQRLGQQARLDAEERHTWLRNAGRVLAALGQ